MIYGSVCSGIEAASLAWGPLGWKAAFMAEVEPFPCHVLTERFGATRPLNMAAQPRTAIQAVKNLPETGKVPNLGDVTTFKEWPDFAIDLLVGGTPCQSYSLAGLRAGLDDPRGDLMLTYVAIARRYRPRWVVWENVPGVLSNNDGRDFATLLGLLTGRHVSVPKGGWETAGVVPGIERAYGIAWRVLDAQFVRVDGHRRAVPQRRRRVFIAGYIGDWRCAAAVLLERESLSGNHPPRRKTGEEVAATIDAGAGRRRGAGINHSAIAPAVARPVTAARGKADPHDHTQQTYVAFGGNRTSGPIDVAPALQSHPSPSGRQDFESDTFITCPPVAGTLKSCARSGTPNGAEEADRLIVVNETVATLDANYAKLQGASGQDANHGHSHLVAEVFKPAHFTRGKGGGAPSETAYALTKEADRGDTEQVVAFDKSQITNPDNRSQPRNGISPTLPGGDQIAIAIQERAISENLENGPGGSGVRDDGAAFTIEARHEAQAVAFDCKTAGKNMGFGFGEVPGALRGEGHGGGHAAVLQEPVRGARYVVRRLMPVECERLQAMPDGHTDVIYRGKPAKDGPRYKAIGNSMAVNVMAWIGRRIQMVEEILAQPQ